jgi:hypothetical protein
MTENSSEPVPISDVYADGIAYIENLGNVIRVAYFVWQRHGKTREKVIVAKIVRPLSSVVGQDEFNRMLSANPVVGILPETNGERHH